MTADEIYPHYLDYVERLRDALQRPPAGPVPEEQLTKKLSRSKFRHVWNAWGDVPGRQELWASRFLAGFEKDSEDIRRRILGSSANGSTARAAA